MAPVLAGPVRITRAMAMPTSNIILPISSPTADAESYAYSWYRTPENGL
jgi:hypothetical protein